MSEYKKPIAPMESKQLNRRKTGLQAQDTVRLTVSFVPVEIVQTGFR